MHSCISYEEYMANVLGYQPNPVQNLYQSNDYYIAPVPNNCQMDHNNLEKYYPDVYMKVYPLVCNECNKISGPVTEEMIQAMTETVYKSIELDLKIETKSVRQTEDRQTGRNNNFLRDLIRILILREILGGGGRPPFPGPGPRPPFPGGPGMPPPPRPPFPGPGPRPPFPGGPGPIRPREF